MITQYRTPPATPLHATGWRRVRPAGRRAFLVRWNELGHYDCVPEVPLLARDTLGRPRFSLTLLLSRLPHVADETIAPLVTSGRLALVTTLAVEADDLDALVRRVGVRCAPAFITHATVRLASGSTVFASVDGAGGGASFAFATPLPGDAALDVLRAIDGAHSALEIRFESVDQRGPAPVMPAPLELLVGGIIDGLERSAYVSLIVPNADGSVTPVPRLVREIPAAAVRERAAAEPMAMAMTGNNFVALPFAMAPNTAIKPSAAAMISTGATDGGGILSPAQRYWLGNDLVVPPDDPPQFANLPIVDDATAVVWNDAVDSATLWYPPSFTLVPPAANDDPQNAAFAFTFHEGGPILGGGGLTTGLTATIRLTVRMVASPASATAFAAAYGATPKQVPLNNLSCSLEIPYRAAGSAVIQAQRFPATAVVEGDTIRLSVDLLDDWVRLAYSALAYPPTTTDQGALRIVLGYAFPAYVHVNRGNINVVFGGKRAQIDELAWRDELPPQLNRATFVAKEAAIYAPLQVVQFLREAPLAVGERFRLPPRWVTDNGDGEPRPPVRPPVPIVVTAPIPLPPVVPVPIVPPRPVSLGTRTIVREDIVDAQLPCSQFGGLYLQSDGAGQLQPVGCQDALKLGETASKAFDEIAALQTPAYRVYKSLQQPGRFMLVPAAYRVGRYAATEGDKAYRPMVLLYGVFDADPNKSRYCLSATLTADVSAADLALLRSALAPHTPAGMTPQTALPTDPFVAAAITYAWTVFGGLDQPQTLTVIDAFNVGLTIGLSNAALLTTLIDNSGLQGAVTFALPDGMSFTSALAIDGAIVGPAETGPVTVALHAAGATLTNCTQQAVNVFELALLDANSNATAVPANVALAPGASTELLFAQTGVSAYATARLAQACPIGELDVFVEDMTLTVQFINQVNFANHALTALQVNSRIKGIDHIEAIALAEGTTQSVSFTLPVTTYLSNQTLEFALLETTATGSVTTPWREWNLNSGTVIGITIDLL